METDILTFILVLKAKDPIATRQFLRYLTTVDQFDYQKTVVRKGIGFVGHDDALQWVEGLF